MSLSSTKLYDKKSLKIPSKSSIKSFSYRKHVIASLASKVFSTKVAFNVTVEKIEQKEKMSSHKNNEKMTEGNSPQENKLLKISLKTNEAIFMCLKVDFSLPFLNLDLYLFYQIDDFKTHRKHLLSLKRSKESSGNDLVKGFMNTLQKSFPKSHNSTQSKRKNKFYNEIIADEPFRRQAVSSDASIEIKLMNANETIASKNILFDVDGKCIECGLDSSSTSHKSGQSEFFHNYSKSFVKRNFFKSFSDRTTNKFEELSKVSMVKLTHQVLATISSDLPLETSDSSAVLANLKNFKSRLGKCGENKKKVQKKLYVVEKQMKNTDHVSSETVNAKLKNLKKPALLPEIIFKDLEFVSTSRGANQWILRWFLSSGESQKKGEFSCFGFWDFLK